MNRVKERDLGLCARHIIADMSRNLTTLTLFCFICRCHAGNILEINNLKRMLSRDQFAIKDLEPIKKILGMMITRDMTKENSVFLMTEEFQIPTQAPCE